MLTVTVWTSLAAPPSLEGIVDACWERVRVMLYLWFSSWNCWFWRIGTDGGVQARIKPIRSGCIRLFRCLTGEQMANTGAPGYAGRRV